MMNHHVEVITKIPEDLFQGALSEVLKIDWDNLPVKDKRKNTSDGQKENGHVFETSTTCHLRYHAITPGMPLTIQAHSAVVECKDTVARAMYPKVNELSEWIYNYVNGTHLGRIMLVRLSATGKIPLHIDPGEYFLKHYRFHVPLVTTDKMVFINKAHKELNMPVGYLSQLNNRAEHGAINYADTDRIHMIIDIDSENQRYGIPSPNIG